MYEDINSTEFEEKMSTDSNGVLLDVRTPEEHDLERIPNALLIDIMDPEFKSRIEELDKSKNYYVYCRSGNRSGQACMYMQNNGFDGELYNLAGGIMGWLGDIEK